MDRSNGVDAMRAALANEIIIRNIFSYLSLENLKQCRLVKQKWNFEACSYIRDFRQCNANIDKLRPCWNLKHLDEIVGQMTTAMPINSLSIKLSPHFSLLCTKYVIPEVNYSELLRKLSLRYLYVFWDGGFSVKKCPAIKFVIALLREKIQELQFLHLDCNNDYLCELGADWRPAFPKLTVFYAAQDDTWDGDEEVISKIINGAPNLKKLKGMFDMLGVDDMDLLPREKYNLLDTVDLRITSVEQAKIFLEIAQAAPQLSSLRFSAPSDEDDAFMGSFLRILELLLISSSRTLKELNMSAFVFPFTFIDVPSMTHVKILIIEEPSAEAGQLLSVLRSIDYPKMLPVLNEVRLNLLLQEQLEEEPVENPWESNIAAAEAQLQFCPSTSVKILEVKADLVRVTFQDLRKIFTNVRAIEAATRKVDTVQYKKLWCSWPQLESISLEEGGAALKKNFDATFLGIYPEECDLLRELDEKSLENMNIVPIRPCILTMPGKFYIFYPH